MPNSAGRKRAILAGSTALSALMLFAAPQAACAQEQTFQFEIASQDLADSLRAIAAATRAQVTFQDEALRDRTAPAVSGTMTVQEALRRALAGSGLDLRRGKSGLWIVGGAHVGESVAAGGGRNRGSSYGRASLLSGEDRAGGATADSESAEWQDGYADILVRGRRTQNVDIRRSENDPQPYVVFDSDDIRTSQSGNLEEFLRTRLPMNTQNQISSQVNDFSNGTDVRTGNNISQINLRGFGAAQTLILIDGRRVPRILATDFTQGDINGIPLAAIERIEVLPSTSGGIYGGGAVGGVINIIRRRDYRGGVVRATFDGTFRGGGESFRGEISGGFTPDHGSTNISYSASYSRSQPLLLSDNDLWRRSRELFAANDPLNQPFAGATINIQSARAFIPSCPCVGNPNLTLDSGVALNSNRTFVPDGYQGVTTDQGAGLVANAGRYNLDLSSDARGRRGVLRNGPEIFSVNANVRREIFRGLDVFADFTYAWNRGRTVITGNPQQINFTAADDGNPFQQAVQVVFSIPESVRPVFSTSTLRAGTFGAIAQLGSGWVSNVEYSISRASSTTTYTKNVLSPAFTTAVRNGTINIFRDLDTPALDVSSYLIGVSPDGRSGPSTTSQQIASLRTSGPLFELPGGRLTTTSLLEYRRDRASRVTTIDPGTSIYVPPRSQEVLSGYLELTAPIVSDRNAFTLVRSLELQAAIRYDRYSTSVPNPSNVNPYSPSAALPSFTYRDEQVEATSYTAALLWQPVDGIQLRGSFATGFRPPSISELVPTLQVGGSFFGITDPARGGEIVGTFEPWNYLAGGNPALQPETSESFSAGVIIRPVQVPGLRLSVDYNWIDKSGEISSLQLPYVVQNEAGFPSRVQRGPRRSTDPAGWPGPITLIDISLANISRRVSEAIDVNLEYAFQTRRSGSFNFYITGTRQLSLSRQILPQDVPFESVGLFDGPLETRVNGGARWEYRGLRVGWAFQYYSGYSLRYGDPSLASIGNTAVTRQGGVARIPSQAYHDLYVSYRFGRRFGLDGIEVTAGIQNVFDRNPPVIASPYAGYSQYGDPRLRRFSMSLTGSF